MDKDEAASKMPGAATATARELGSFREQWQRVWRKLCEGGALMVGVPDYDRYVAHMKAVHPDHVPLSREAFVRLRMEARYGGKGSGKCPC